jgi:hypothetical protein
MRAWLKYKIVDGVSVDRALIWLLWIVAALSLIAFVLRTGPKAQMPVYHAGPPFTMELHADPPTGENLEARGMLPELPDNRENRWLREAQEQDHGNHKSDTIDKDH